MGSTEPGKRTGGLERETVGNLDTAYPVTPVIQKRIHLVRNRKYSRSTAGGRTGAAEQYELVAGKYGEDDTLRFAKAQGELDSGNITDAQNTVSTFQNRHSRMYYTVSEQIIQEQFRTDDELSAKLLDLYIKASKDNPDWWYPAKNAGGLLYDQGNFNEAVYYLTRAYIYDEHPDGETAYYLGSCFMETGNTDEGVPLLIQALDFGVSETIESHISWYLHSVQSKGEEAEQHEENKS